MNWTDEEANRQKQKFINYNNSPKGKADYLESCRGVAKDISIDELREVISDVAEYSEVYRKVCELELANRLKKQ